MKFLLTNEGRISPKQAPRGEWTPSPPQWAEIDWTDHGKPVSRIFGDVFFSGSGALEESEWVFLRGTRLSERVAAGDSIVLAELGFGAGLNFLNTWNLLSRSPSPVRLHYIAFEKYLWRSADLERLYQQWPQFSENLKKLRQALPPLIAGFHALSWPEENIFLTLCVGDIAEFLPLLAAKVDIWFLDGFAPAKNPQMWSEEICRAMARCSNPGAHLATYSVARTVRDSLSSAGFSVAVERGFGQKREMLTAHYSGENIAQPYFKQREDSQLLRRAPALPARQSEVSDVAVIGAGLAGCAVASSFAQRGMKVVVLEESEDIATKASGNRAAVFMPYLSVKPDFLSRFNTAGYLFTQSVLKRLRGLNVPLTGQQCGVLRLATSSRLQTLSQSLVDLSLPEDFARAVSSEEGSRLCGIGVNKAGLWFASGGWLWPENLCRALLLGNGERVDIRYRAKVAQLERDSHWSLLDEAGGLIAKAQIVVFANGYQAQELAMLSHLPLEQVRGQVSTLRESAATKRLSAVLCYDGYLTPADHGSHLLGATFEHQNYKRDVSAAQEQQLIERFAAHVENCQLSLTAITGSRVSFRTMSPDRLPLIGAAPKAEGFLEAYKEANGGNFGPFYPAEAVHPGVYLSLGHGSRGLLSCLIAGEIIAAMVCREPMPLESDLLRAVDPCRFLVRAIRRGQGQGGA